jgi:molybdopterin molybdotransferase
MTLVAPSWEDARVAAHACGRRLPAETLPVSQADGRVVLDDVRARTPLPPRDASAMDGWAVRGEGPWRVVDEVHAGRDRDESLESGQAVGIATGAALPLGTTAVLRSEHGEIDEAGLLHGAVADHTDVRSAGEEADEGELLIPARTRLSPAHLGLAAAGGHDELAVMRCPRAVVLILGDELLRSGLARDGKIRDSLGAQVPAWLDRMGVEVLAVEPVTDSLEAHVNALRAVEGADLVVTTGGTAHGPVDFLRAALAATDGRLGVDTVEVRPGSPMILGAWAGGRWLVGLPGNPQAAIVALMTLALPLVDALVGRPLADLGTRRLAAPVVSRGTRTRLVPCVDVGGAAAPAEFIGSGMLRGLAASDGFAVVAGGQGAVGAIVPWLPLP